MKLTLTICLLAMVLAGCGRKAPLTPVPGTLLGDLDFSQLAPQTESEDVFDQPSVDENWFVTTPSEDDDDDDDDEDE